MAVKSRLRQRWAEFQCGSAFENPRAADNGLWTIKPSPNHGRHYQVLIKDRNATIELFGTLFRLDKTWYLDLYPERDSGMRHEDSSVTPSEIIHTFMYERRHVIWKVEVTDTNVTYYFPFADGTTVATAKAPALKRKSLGIGHILVLPEPRVEAQGYLRQFADDTNVFNYRGQLLKKQKEG